MLGIKKADESIDHVVSGCSKLAQKEYKRRHDNLGKAQNKSCFRRRREKSSPW